KAVVPSLTGEDLAEALQRSAVNFGTLPHDVVGAGLINVAAALDIVRPPKAIVHELVHGFHVVNPDTGLVSLFLYDFDKQYPGFASGPYPCRILRLQATAPWTGSFNTFPTV